VSPSFRLAIRPFPALLAASAGIALAFLLLPIAAIFARVPPGDLVGALGRDAALDALVVTAKTSGIAIALTLAVGTPAAYLLATSRFRGRALVVTLLELPLVLPPAVAGLGLLVTFGRAGLLGDTLEAFGVRVGFTQAAVVLAVLFVAGPLYVRQAVAAFEAVDPDLLLAARTLGAGPGRVFRRVALPLASGGLTAGAALSFARGIGEFGATITFAGSLQGVTQTVTLAVYRELEVDLEVALALGALLVVASALVLISIKLLVSWRASGSTSPFRFATSSSG
jgi:molybdate transport system permease protein